jgi:hypothetical protein
MLPRRDMPGRMSGSVSAALSGSVSDCLVSGPGSCDFVPAPDSGCLVSGSVSCDFVPAPDSGCHVSASVPASGSGCEARHYNLHMLPGHVSEA